MKCLGEYKTGAPCSEEHSHFRRHETDDGVTRLQYYFECCHMMINKVFFKDQFVHNEISYLTIKRQGKRKKRTLDWVSEETRRKEK